MNVSRQRGFTLIELIISIVIISIAITGILLVMNHTTQHSADPMIEHQAVAVAESYLEEILSKAYTDPDGTNAGETRATYDDVDDYATLPDSVVRDQFGNAVAALAGYQVTVAVVPQTINGQAMKRVDVRVRNGTLVDITVSGYRGNY